MPLQTGIFRSVFRVVPDDLVTTWKHYKDFAAYHERVLKPVRENFCFDSPLLKTSFFYQLEDDLSSEPLGQVPSAGRVERTLDEQVTQQEPRAEDVLTTFFSLKTHEEPPTHLTNGDARGGTSKGEKSITEKPTVPQAGEKTASAMFTEKINGAVFQDKGKKNRGESPFTKQEREEKEALLNDLCGHLGQYLAAEGTH
jgi:phospholipase D1/2